MLSGRGDGELNDVAVRSRPTTPPPGASCRQLEPESATDDHRWRATAMRASQNQYGGRTSPPWSTKFCWKGGRDLCARPIPNVVAMMGFGAAERDDPTGGIVLAGPPPIVQASVNSGFAVAWK